MNKILCIVGPTGTGKTAKAIELSKDQPSILISADSRQVYRGMDIVTGKDHPERIKIYGIDIVDPDESCSVAVWHDSVMPMIKRAWEVEKLPIIVGGTGLYVKSLTDGMETMQVPINQLLRVELQSLSIPELQDQLSTLNKAKYDSMNHSDQNNPRRLIRAIEIAKSLFTKSSSVNLQLSIKTIGLKYFDESNHRSNIIKRVMSRLSHGAVAETRSLLIKYGKNPPSMSAIGYQSIIRYLENNLTEKEMVEDWAIKELSYAKRQMTWFRKQSVIWYDIDKSEE